MIGTTRFIFAVVGLLVVLAGGAFAFGWLIEIPNFEGLYPPRLLGYLARPSGTGRFPAVVILHGCSGLSGGNAEIADRLRVWGYVALAIDSFGPRGIATACGSWVGQEYDAHAALHYLSQQDFIDPERVAMLGYSMGGGSALRIAREGSASEFEEKFRVAIAYYPECGGAVPAMAIPTMILIGASDDWTPAEPCRELADRLQKNGTPIDLTVYPGAHHAFNFPQAKPGFRSLGHWLEYNEPAARDAETKLRGFLAANLQPTAEQEGNR
jgi:dienelactone hydrolase